MRHPISLLVAGWLCTPSTCFAATSVTVWADTLLGARTSGTLADVSESPEVWNTTSPTARVKRSNPLTWTIEGRKLSATQAEALETAVAANPEDLESRLRLIGWLDSANLFDHRLRSRKNDHALWLIEHKADAGPDFWSHLGLNSTLDGPEANLRALDAWKRQVDARPGSTPLLESAATSVQYLDRRVSLEYYSRAAKLSPRDPHWPDKIAFIHYLAANTRDRELQYTEASLALKFYEQAIGLTNDSVRSYSNLYEYASQSAWLVDRNDKATRWANALLKGARAGEWWFNNARHAAYTILGLVALDEGKLAEACKDLMLSAESDAKATGVFMPSVTLAAALLDRGEKEVVVEYLDAQRELAQYQPERYAEMAAAIRGGGVPEGFKTVLRKIPPKPKKI